MFDRLFRGLRAAPPGRTPAEEPFRTIVRGDVVVVDCFSREIRQFYSDLERELPILRDALALLVEDGRTRFIFDLRTADSSSAYPIVKWGAMYGVVSQLRRRNPDISPTSLASGIKLVGSGELLVEINGYLADVFESFDTLEEAIEAFRRDRS